MRTWNLLLIAVLLTACGGSEGQLNDNANNNNNNNNNENLPAICGDGIVDTGEACDDGTANSDTLPNSCRSDCRLPYCGDHVRDEGEDCDTDNLTSQDCSGVGLFNHGDLTCADDCTYDTTHCSFCGDGTAEGEDGDPGYETCDGSDLREQDCVSVGQAAGILRCAGNCEWDISECTGGGPVCGNSVIESNEECDDGNNAACDGCSETCHVEICGNGIVECMEQCDDGNTDAGDSCSPLCNLEICGNGFADPGESCDDGNLQFGDGCSGDCQSDETCGNGYLDAIEGEECDDASANSDTTPDACRTDCTQADCGDGVIDTGEVCDGTLLNGVTCNDLVPGWQGTPTCFTCATFDIMGCWLCGDGDCAAMYGENWGNCPQDCP